MPDEFFYEAVKKIEALDLDSWGKEVRRFSKLPFEKMSIEEIRPLVGALLPGGLALMKMEFDPGVTFTRICRHDVRCKEDTLARPESKILNWSRCGPPRVSLLYLGASRSVCEHETPLRDGESYFVVEYEAKHELAFSTFFGWPFMTSSPDEQVASAANRIDGLSKKGQAKLKIVLRMLLDALVSNGSFEEPNDLRAHHLSATIAQCFLAHPEAHGFTWPAVKMGLKGQSFALNREHQSRLEITSVIRVIPNMSQQVVFSEGAWVS